MTTVVNSTSPATDSGGNFLIGILILIGFIIFLWYFAIPAMKNMGGPAQLNVPAPQIAVPDKIDVNVNQAK
jgi:hypothetical protein